MFDGMDFAAEVAAAQEKATKATEARRQGMSYSRIARIYGYKDERDAFQAVQKVIQATIREEAKDVVQLELERLDRMQVGLYDAAKRGEVKAVDRVLRIMKRRAELLGLDAPTKLDINEKLVEPIKIRLKWSKGAGGTQTDDEAAG